MSDKPLSAVDEIMKLVMRYGAEIGAFYRTPLGSVSESDVLRQSDLVLDHIRAELEKLVKAAGDPS